MILSLHRLDPLPSLLLYRPAYHQACNLTAGCLYLFVLYLLFFKVLLYTESFPESTVNISYTLLRATWNISSKSISSSQIIMVFFLSNRCFPREWFILPAD